MEVTFDQVARESQFIVRGTVDKTFSAWDDAHEVIYTYATVRVHRYFGETTGPDTVLIREVGGTVDGYTQEAIGFPAIRAGEEVVLMLSRWEDSADFRIHAFNQGKYLVRNRGGVETLVSDPVQQGHGRMDRDRDVRSNAAAEEAEAPGLSIAEFAQMVDDARAGVERPAGRDKRQ
jgi:hypothetical protein